MPRLHRCPPLAAHRGPTPWRCAARLGPCLALALALGAPDDARADTAADETCETALCVREGKAKFTPEATLSAKGQRKEARKHRKRKAVELSVEIEGGRGSVFIDGRWVGEAPVRALELKPGRHDVQVRDGSTVLDAGILTITRGSDPVRVTVTHPEADGPSAET